MCPHLWKDKYKEHIQNVYTSISYIWKDIHKELVTLVPGENRVLCFREGREIHSLCSRSFYVYSISYSGHRVPVAQINPINFSIRIIYTIANVLFRNDHQKYRLSKITEVSLDSKSSWSLIPRRESKSPLIREASLWSHLLQSK